MLAVIIENKLLHHISLSSIFNKCLNYQFFSHFLLLCVSGIVFKTVLMHLTCFCYILVSILALKKTYSQVCSWLRRGTTWQGNEKTIEDRKG